MWQPRLGVSWDPGADGKQVVRASAGIFYARIPGLNLASTRSTDGTRGQTLYRDSTFNGFGVTPPAWPNLIPQSQISSPDHPDVFVFDKNFQNPRTYSATLSYERELVTNLSMFATFTHSKTVHVTRFINRNDAVFGRPWSTGLGADNTNGVDEPDDRRQLRQVEVRRLHRRHEQALRAELPVPVELHDRPRHVRRRQRARSVHLPLRERPTTWRPSTTTPTATSATASTRGCW